MDDIFYTYGVEEILSLVASVSQLSVPYAVKRKRADLLLFLNELPDEHRLVISDAARQKQGTKRKPKGEGRGPRRKKAKVTPGRAQGAGTVTTAQVNAAGAPSVQAPNGTAGQVEAQNVLQRSGATRPLEAQDAQVERQQAAETGDSALITDILKGPFLEPVSEEVVNDSICRYIDKTGNAAMRKEVCMVCARRLFMEHLRSTTVADLPNKEWLIPWRSHPAHELTGEWLLHRPALDKPEQFVCLYCLRKLKAGSRPPLSLANEMWIGRVPFELSILTLPESLLVALYFPAAYVVKLYPKSDVERDWNKQEVNSGMKGNVSTYRLNTAQIAGLSAGNTMPPSSKVLAATIGVTFVGVGKKPLKVLPDFLRVRRQRVFDALVWLRANNPLYSEIEISQDQLRLLPEDAVPEEITLNAKYSDDIGAVHREQAGYIPRDAEDEAAEAELFRQNAARAEEQVTMQTVGQPSGTHHLEEDDEGVQEDEAVYGTHDAAVFPLQAMGVVDAHAETVPDNDLFAHAFANAAEAVVDQDFGVRPSSAFVNEYPRLDEMKERFDGGPANPNHLLGAFPVLFPYGRGAVEVARPVTVAYEAHVRWALQYDDARFRKHLYFIFQAFGVLQKRQVCRSAGLQIKRSSFIANQLAFLKLKPQDFLLASGEETRRVPFTNPVIRKLRQTLTSVRSRVQGTDESRIAIRAQIWGTNLRFNPPVIWATWSMADTADPIAQVLAGEEIDLDAFIATSGPIRSQRIINVASDPYAAAEFFHKSVGIILEEVFGIKVVKRGCIERKPGILGIVNAYIGTVEAQARGTLHLHIMFWLQGAPTAAEMQKALSSELFREKVARFIKQNIRADIKGTDARSLMALKKEANITYSRPVDPRSDNYELRRHEAESRIARAVQMHGCDTNTCLRSTPDGGFRCKRRAPWALSSEDWVMPNGEWGPRRVHGRMNAWNPALLQIMRSNQDMKLVTNGQETKDIAFYITLYIAKKQIQASNASALLAKSVAFHKKLNERQAAAQDVNKRMLQQCANTLSRQHEFSGPEVISYLMGWGDRFISHNFTPIYWDQISSALRRTFPLLQGKRVPNNVVSITDVAPAVAASHEEEEGMMQLKVVDGQFVLKDQLKEYSDRGVELEDMSFYDYFVLTYDGAMLVAKKAGNADDGGEGEQREDDVEDEEAEGVRGKAGRPASRRVPYLPESERKGCRIFRGDAYETCLHFIGRWFPRSDRDEREFYCANILALLRPWRELGQLQGEDGSFETAFDGFLATASVEHKRIIDNIQYFHECSDGSERKRAEGLQGQGGALLLDDELRQAAERQELNELMVPLTEADVDTARNNRYAAREFIYGLNAIAVAKDLGIFTDEGTSTCYREVAQRATVEEHHKYNDWGKKVAAITRAANYVVDNSAAVAPPDEEVVDTVVSGPVDQYGEAVIDMRHSDEAVRTQEQQEAVDKLNTEQRRAHDIIERHLRRTLAGQEQDQLLMIVRGEGGTRKTVLLNAISHTFDFLRSSALLAKTATTGVAASLIGGQTVHSWAGIPVTARNDPNWMSTASAATIAKRKRNILPAKYLEVDEFSMMTKKLLAQLSQVIGSVRASAGEGRPSMAFGGMNVIIFGDLHQFPPVGDAKGALYCPADDKLQSKIGLQLYHQFTTVVTLTEQKRITDLTWKALLQRLRNGACTEEDIAELEGLLVTHPSSVSGLPSWNEAPWADAVLVTPRHGSRMQWNSEALRKHCARTGNRMYICQAEDTCGRADVVLDLRQRVIVAGMKTKQTGKLAERVEIAVGMRAMVLLNISTEGDLANGTRGEVVDIKLDIREPLPLVEDEATGAIMLRYPPAMVLFKPDTCSFPPFEGLPPGLLPIVPSKMGFSIQAVSGGTVTIHRRQLAITPGYAFTDYKSQGQTIEFVLVDLEKPPTSSLTPFNAYVALSRSRGRGSIRLLRGFDPKLFTTHPSPDLAVEDARLDALTVKTKARKH